MERDSMIRTYRPGEPSLVAHFNYRLFEQQFDLLPNIENYFLHIVTELFDDLDGNELWVAEQDGKIVGSICVIGRGGGEAQLRLFATDPSVQGRGIGKKLMEKAMDFCREKDYHHVILWTIDICKAARHLYARSGFRPTETKPNTSWADYEMTEEKWEYVERQM